MSIKPFVMILGIALILNSCKPSDEEQARLRLNKAKALIEQKDTTQALLQLDSLQRMFPKAMYSVNAAKNMAAEIKLSLLGNKQTKLDSANAHILRLENSFDKVKTEYDRYTQYIHKKQNFDRGVNRSFIQVHLDERGDIYLSSNYYGQAALKHYALRVYDGELSAKTDSIPVGSDDNRASDFMEFKWEKVNYRNGCDNGVLAFIAQNADRKLKAVFIGRQQQFIILEDFDKKAIKDAFDLSSAIKKRTVLEKEVQRLKQQMQIK